MFSTLLFLFNVVVGYLVGSICSAVIVSRLFDLPDPRLEGSKNPGATNVLRLSGKKYAAIVLVADMLKGLLPVLLAKLLGGGPIIVGFTCLAAVMGHMYPLYFNFKGGKGVATAMGALLGFHFLLGVIVIATWLLIANLFRYSSLASIVSMVLAPFYSLFAVGNPSAFLPLIFISLFILYKHRENVTRLMDGTEPKMNFGHKKPIREAKSIPPQSTLKTAKTASSKTIHKATPKTSKVAPKPSKAAPKPSKAAPKPSKPTASKETPKPKAKAKVAPKKKAPAKAKITAPKKPV